MASSHNGTGDSHARAGTVYAVVQEKGGVGKTTTTINLGAWFGELGYRTLLVDLDPQGNLAKGLGVPGAPGAMYRVLRDPAAPFDDAIVSTALPNVDLAPADTSLEAAEIELIHALSRESVLRRKMEQAALRERYDCVLIDCRPSLGVLTVNAMVAADKLVIPVETQYFAIESLQTLLDVVKTVRDSLRPDLQIAGIVPTKHEPRVRVCQVTLEMLRERYPELLTGTIIRKYVAYGEAQLRGEPIYTVAPGTDASESYRALALELTGERPKGALRAAATRRNGHAARADQIGVAVSPAEQRRSTGPTQAALPLETV
jgi:chromosome partitioning protein